MGRPRSRRGLWVGPEALGGCGQGIGVTQGRGLWVGLEAPGSYGYGPASSLPTSLSSPHSCTPERAEAIAPTPGTRPPPLPAVWAELPPELRPPVSPTGPRCGGGGSSSDPRRPRPPPPLPPLPERLLTGLPAGPPPPHPRGREIPPLPPVSPQLLPGGRAGSAPGFPCP